MIITADLPESVNAWLDDEEGNRAADFQLLPEEYSETVRLKSKAPGYMRRDKSYTAGGEEVEGWEGPEVKNYALIYTDSIEFICTGPADATVCFYLNTDHNTDIDELFFRVAVFVNGKRLNEESMVINRETGTSGGSMFSYFAVPLSVSGFSNTISRETIKTVEIDFEVSDYTFLYDTSLYDSWEEYISANRVLAIDLIAYTATGQQVSAPSFRPAQCTVEDNVLKYRYDPETSYDEEVTRIAISLTIPISAATTFTPVNIVEE